MTRSKVPGFMQCNNHHDVGSTILYADINQHTTYELCAPCLKKAVDALPPPKLITEPKPTDTERHIAALDGAGNRGERRRKEDTQ
jgi:hypothetical protein